MFCLTDLENAYNKVRKKNGWSEKQITKYFNNEYEMEFILELLQNTGVIYKKQNSPFYETVENKEVMTTENFKKLIDKRGLIYALKKVGQYSMKGKGADRVVFCNPYIFVAVAMWLNPQFKAKVVVWVGDQLIVDRIMAGERYKRLTRAIYQHILPTIDETQHKYIYSDFAKLLNKFIFGEHSENLRQLASDKAQQYLNSWDLSDL